MSGLDRGFACSWPQSGLRVLVTGASGMIGAAVVRELAGRGIPVRAQVRDSAHPGCPRPCPEVEIASLDFNDCTSGELKALLAGCACVVHCAALVHNPRACREDYERANVRATEMLAGAAAASQVSRFIFLSTSAVYGSGSFSFVDETAATAAESPYAASKLASESWLRDSRLFATTIVLRPPLVFGEGDRGNMIKLIRAIKRGRFVHLSDKAKQAMKSLIYAADLASAVWLCMDRLPPGFHVLNAANAEPVSLRHLTGEIAGALGRKDDLIELPSGFVRAAAGAAVALFGRRAPVTPAEIDRLTATNTLDTRLIASTTGFTARHSLKLALAREVAWAEENALI